MGKFIVFEGIDGSGKSTQIDLLRSKLLSIGQDVHMTTEPTDRSIGKLIRQILGKEIEASEETLAALFVADRLDHIQNTQDGMHSKLENDTHVISDRYYWSSYAYHGLSMPISKVVEMNDICHQLLKPDLTIYLDLTAEESMKRIEKRNEKQEKFEKLELLQGIRQNYFIAFEKYKKDARIEVVNANQSIETCAAEIWELVSPLFKSALLKGSTLSS